MNKLKAIFKHKIFGPESFLISQDTALLAFRVLVSLSMINTHGMKKLLHYSDTVAHIPDPFGLGGEISTIMAIFANIVAPFFIIIGLGTRLATIPILSVTLMGFFVVHGADPWPVRDVPLMYSLVYLLIFFLGAGRHSLDYQLHKNV